MLASSMPLNASTGQRTGELANEPATAYREGTDIFSIHHADGTNNTTYALEERVYINLTTNRAHNLQTRNRLRVYDYQNTRLIDNNAAFVVTDNTPPTYSYEAFFDASTPNGFTNDTYVVEVNIESNNHHIFRTMDTILVGNGSTPLRYIRTFTDANFTNTDWVFNADETVYIELWTGGTVPDTGNSNIEFANYRDDRDGLRMNNLQNTTLTANGNYTRLAYDLGVDLDTQAVQINDGWWYTIRVDLQNQAGADIIQMWTVQIYINIKPVINPVGAVPDTVEAVGTSTTVLYAQFTDLDAPGATAFNVTMMVREPNDLTILTLVDAKMTGQGGLTITALGGGIYNATVSWDPPNTQVPGLYDIYVMVRDDRRGIGTSDFAANPDRLNITNVNITPPLLVTGNTRAVPPSVTNTGTAYTTLISDFMDLDNADVSTYNITFWVRNPTNNVIAIVDGRTNGGTGNFGGTVKVIKNSASNYTASIDLVPDASFTAGLYDLYFRVVDATNSTAIDPFNNNIDELEITSGNSRPQFIEVLATPNSVNRLGVHPTNISGTFTDRDNHNVSGYLITVEVMDPVGTTITIAQDVQNGSAGAFGAMMSVSRIGTIYTAVISWDPADTVQLGYYDLRMSIDEPDARTVVSDFTDNPDELLISSVSRPPVINPGDTWASPPTVMRIGSNTTVLYANFSSPDEPAVNTMRVTFKVQDPNNNQILIVNEKLFGEASEFGRLVNITKAGQNYMASIEWDPADTSVVGKYDLFFSVNDSLGNRAEDAFTNNPDELTILDIAPLPTITAGNTRAVPGSINRDSTDITTLTSEFQDTYYTNPMEFLVTFKVRDPQGYEITLADGKRNGEIGTNGGLVNITMAGSVFTASVPWDPSTTVLAGAYDLYFRVMDPVGGFAADDFTNNADELVLTVGHVPVITNLWANPGVVSVKGTTVTTITAEFTDTGGASVADFKVTFTVRSPTGNVITLVKDKMSGQAGEFGNDLVVEMVGSAYNARYDWDPPETIANGLYDLSVEIEDNSNQRVENGFDLNPDELELRGGVSPGNPNIVPATPVQSEGDTIFIVTYIDLEGNPPDMNGMRIVIDGVEYKMTEIADGSSFNTGKKYVFVKELSKGTHTYKFTTTDTTGMSATTDEANVDVTTEAAEKGATSTYNLLLMVLVVVLVVVIVFLLAMLLGKKQGRTPAQYQQPPRPKEQASTGGSGKTPVKEPEEIPEPGPKMMTTKSSPGSNPAPIPEEKGTLNPKVSEGERDPD